MSEPKSQPPFPNPRAKTSKVVSATDEALSNLGNQLDTVQPTQIQPLLNNLAKASRQLNEATDELTKHVLQIESLLNGLNLGIEASVPVETSFDRRKVSLDLGWGKNQGRWVFTIWRSAMDHEPWAFRNAPREYRVAVVDKIPALLSVLLEKSTDLASAMAVKSVFVSELLSNLSKPGPTTGSEE